MARPLDGACFVVITLLVGVVSCGSADDDGGDDVGDEGGLHIVVDGDADADVEAARLTVTGCEDRDHPIVSEESSLDAWPDSAASSSVDGDVLLEDFRDVTPGCYDIDVELLDADGSDAAACTRATGRDIEVGSGEVVEVLLFSRCDAVSGLQVEMLEFRPSPSRRDCAESVDICATIYGEGSEVATYWDYAPPREVGPWPETTTSEQPSLHRVDCVRWAVDGHPTLDIHLSAYPARAETTNGGATVLFSDTDDIEARLRTGCDAP